jgi:cytochrome oxidase Cu insertion factor (SCO1/SenC/PrrC family)
MTSPDDGKGTAPASRRPWAIAGVGVALAALLVVVLFVGLGTGGASGFNVPSMEQQATGANLEPGINAATSMLLSLTVFPPASHKSAADFSLTDQNGRPLSLTQFRGKVVIVSVNDDQCPDLCTLLANDIVAANADLGAAARNVVWLSVNANPFHPQVSAVKAWTDEHGLGDQANWYFGTSTPSVLEKVWREYGVVVEQDPQSRTVQHGTELFYVDPTGQEQAVAQFGTDAASTALFAHGMAQMADDLLPTSARVRIAGPEAPAPTGHNATVSATAPTFSVPYLDNPRRAFSLSADRGRYVVVNFWASTCSVCKTELPQIEKAFRFAGSQVDFVGVDESDLAGAARTMAQGAGLSYPLVSDHDGVAAGDERITGLPFTVILNPAGQVMVRHPGTFTTEQLEYILETYVPSLPSS